MRRGVVNVVVALLHVFPMIAFPGSDTEKPFLEVAVTAVPEGRSEAEPLKPVADSRDAVLSPAVGLRSGVFVGQIPPGVAVGGIILPDGSPGAVGEIRAPAAPAGGVVVNLANTGRFRVVAGHGGEIRESGNLADHDSWASGGIERNATEPWQPMEPGDSLG